MVIYCHGSLYFQTDVSLFISFSFLHLDCVSQRTCLNLLMASKRSIYSCWMFGRWLLRWIKTMLASHRRHVLLLISSDLTALPFELSGKQMEKGRKKKKKGCCYILSSGQRPCWEPSRRGMYSIDPWWDETVTLLHGENKFWIFLFSVFFSIFFPFFLKPLKFPTVFIMCVASFSVSVDDALEIFFFFLALNVQKKLRGEKREVVWNPKNR